jgi:transposase
MNLIYKERSRLLTQMMENLLCVVMITECDKNSMYSYSITLISGSTKLCNRNNKHNIAQQDP